MEELKTAEHVAYFMSKKISLSRFDSKFVESLQILDRVTTNQVELFYKIIYKYRRQFIKHELCVEKLIHLPWTTTVVESATQYTDGHVSISNNQIIFRCPYNRTFIDDFRKVEMNHFIWQKEERYYETEYSEHSLKLLMEVASKYFKTIHLCEVTTELLSSLLEYSSAKIWNPTLMNVNGNLMIGGINPNLHNALIDTVLSTDTLTLSKLVSYGVYIDDALYDSTEPKYKFITSMFPQIELGDVLNIIPWLKDINCDFVVFAGTTIVSKPVVKKLIEALSKENIPFAETQLLNQKADSGMYDAKNPVVIKFRTNIDNTWLPVKAKKFVQIVNSKPVDIK